MWLPMGMRGAGARWWQRGRRRSTETSTIDLRETFGEAQPSAPSRAMAPLPAEAEAKLVARRRAEIERLEAQGELQLLRQRHWSPERVFEESHLGIDWWQHPDADPHAMLAVLPGDPLDQAKRNRRAIARGVHPDRPDVEDPALAQEQMAAVNAAYDRLKRALVPLPEIDDEPVIAVRPRTRHEWSAQLLEGVQPKGELGA